MKDSVKFKSERLSFNRQMVIESLRNNKMNAIHCLAEIDISIPRKKRKSYFEKYNEKISFTAYIIRCFAETFRYFPKMNSFIRRNKLIILEDVTVSVMIEREIDGIKTPEPLGIQNAQNKTVKEIHNEIRNAQNVDINELGNLNGMSWIKFIPKPLIRTFIKIADRNIRMAQRYGKVAITSVGMFSESKAWFIPHGTATVMLTVGTINSENKLNENGKLSKVDILHVNASFDHEIIDGSPAARFMTKFENILKSGDFFPE